MQQFGEKRSLIAFVWAGLTSQHVVNARFWYPVAAVRLLVVGWHAVGARAGPAAA